MVRENHKNKNQFACVNVTGLPAKSASRTGAVSTAFENLYFFSIFFRVSATIFNKKKSKEKHQR